MQPISPNFTQLRKSTCATFMAQLTYAINVAQVDIRSCVKFREIGPWSWRSTKIQNLYRSSRSNRISIQIQQIIQRSTNNSKIQNNLSTFITNKSKILNLYRFHISIKDPTEPLKIQRNLYGSNRSIKKPTYTL